MVAAVADVLLGREFSLLPVRRGSKQPVMAWKAFQTTRASADSVRRWLSRSEIGICTGAISGIVVIDLDTDEAIQWAEAHLDTPVKVQTPRGQHWYFRHPGFPVPNTTGFIDVRGDGGYVLAPGSTGEHGAPYTVLGFDAIEAGVKAWPTSLPVFDPAWVAMANGRALRGHRETVQ